MHGEHTLLAQARVMRSRAMQISVLSVAGETYAQKSMNSLGTLLSIMPQWRAGVDLGVENFDWAETTFELGDSQTPKVHATPGMQATLSKRPTPWLSPNQEGWTLNCCNQR